MVLLPFGVRGGAAHHVNGCYTFSDVLSALGLNRQALYSGPWRNVSSQEMGVFEKITTSFDLEEFFCEVPSLMCGPFF